MSITSLSKSYSCNDYTNKQSKKLEGGVKYLGSIGKRLEIAVFDRLS